MEQEIKISIRQLAEFLLRSGSIDSRFTGINRGVIGSRLHRKIQKQAGKKYTAEVPLTFSCSCGDFVYHLSGRADGIIADENGITLDEIKTVSAPLDSLEESSNPSYWAQASIYAHIFCQLHQLDSIHVRLTYCHIDTEELAYFTKTYTAGQLEDFMQELLAQYNKWALLSQQWKEKRDASLQNLTFPFPAYRAGQRNLAIACYSTYKDAGRLFCSAPTGTGKTLSTLFPALKAIGEGYGQTIFYLTAKTITRQAAEDALSLLGSQSPLYLRSLTLTAKDKACFLEERACLPEICPYANGYYDRVNDAVYSILQQGHRLNRETIQQYAAQYSLCPYELSLDLAQWCDCIICDYNYLFDPLVHLQRFFEGEGGDYLFLVDEAHNLVSRSREMYSASLTKQSFFSFKKQLPKNFTSFHKALNAVNSAFVSLRHQLEEKECATLLQDLPPKEMEDALKKFIAQTELFLEAHKGNELETELLPLYFEALFYQRILEGYGPHYSTLVSQYGQDVSLRLFCMDPSAYLNSSLGLGRAAVLFSATLAPLPYYRKTLGGGEDAKLYSVESPFPPENLGLFIADEISTVYRHREKSLVEIARLLGTMVQAKAGNYIAFFPSYQYMNQVLDTFHEFCPDIETLPQAQGMDEQARENFLARFNTSGEGSLLGFCVMGGVFSEGVDLPGECLIGTAIIGVGLPQLGPENNALREYYEEQEDAGFEFAYQFPGMNKVMQAAGRVIRTETDRGVVLLIDHRYGTGRYRQLFPDHWNHWKKITSSNAPSLLDEFWSAR